MNLPELKIGHLRAKLPIIQGGMGIGISLHKLASSVANQGGIGVISGVQIGFKEPDFISNTLQANLRALSKEIHLAKSNQKQGIIGLNLMTAMKYYKEMVKKAVEEEIDLIISGAGLPIDLPSIVTNTSTKIAPIVSSSRAISVICKIWDRKYKTSPDMVIVEGPKAGGHLGFSKEQLVSSPPDLSKIVIEVKEVLSTYEAKYKKHIPVIAAGGIFNGQDIAQYLKLGIDGVQIGTRFVATEECDAHISYKEAYVNAKSEDIQIVMSPVGMPGRAILNPFIRSLPKSSKRVSCLYNCLTPCNPKQTPYCISEALINAANGQIDHALLFCGTNADKINKIVPVHNLINELVTETKTYLNS